MARTSEATAGDTEIRKIVQRFKPGYKLVADGKAKFKVLDPQGEVVRLTETNRPLTIPNSPAASSVAAAERRLEDLGVLQEQTGPTRTTRGHERHPELSSSANAPSPKEQQSQALERRKNTQELVDAMTSSWIKTIGGWDARGKKSDLAAILHHLYPEVVSSVNSANVMIGKLAAGGASVSDESLAALRRLHEMFEATEDVRGLYNDLVRASKGLGSSMGPVVLKPGEEWPYVVKLLELSELFSDPAYQRPVHEEFVRQLLLTFDERLVGVIDVSRRENGMYAILDGQQRTETMRQANKTQAWCAVYEDMSIKEEAQFFFHKNKDRKNMSAFYGFRARALAEDERALAIQKILSDHGYKLGAATDQDTTIGAVRAVEDVYDFPTEVRDNCLPPTLKLMSQCWRGRKGSTDTEIIRGTGRFFRAFADEEIQYDHFAEAVTALGPQLVIGRARDFSGSTEQRGHGRSMAATLVEIHNTGLGSKDRLSLKRLDK